LSFPTQKATEKFISHGHALKSHRIDWSIVKMWDKELQCRWGFVRIEERKYKDRVIMLTTMLHYMQEKSTPPGLGQSM